MGIKSSPSCLLTCRDLNAAERPLCEQRSDAASRDEHIRPYLLILPSVCVCLGLDRRPRQISNMPFGRAERKDVCKRLCDPGAPRRCQRSSDNKAEATSKIIKVSFLRTILSSGAASGGLQGRRNDSDQGERGDSASSSRRSGRFRKCSRLGDNEEQ